MTLHDILAKAATPGRKRFLFKHLVNLYPPFLGAGIRVRRISEDLRTFEVEMGLHFWNRNYIGTHFGGSLYAMCDAFFLIIILEAMGRDYIVWDKSASIRFRKPGRGKVKAVFHVPDSILDELRAELREKEKTERIFKTEVRAENGDVIAEVEKLIYLKRKA